MSIIKSLKEIENLIPEPDYRLYGSNITEASSTAVLNNPLFAFVVYRKTKVILGAFRVMFMLVKRGNKFYLMVNNYFKESNHSTDYITLEEPKDRKLEKTDWPFVTDEVGLRLDSTCYDKNMIYFGTKADDINIIKEAYSKKRIVKLEPIMV